MGALIVKLGQVCFTEEADLDIVHVIVLTAVNSGILDLQIDFSRAIVGLLISNSLIYLI